MNNIWFTSDTHFGHKNIVLATSSWPDREEKCRRFDSLEEHDQTLIDNINKLVKPDHILYHMGDWSFGGHENIKKYRSKINCKNIHLILGNHDQHIEPKDSPYRGCFSSIKHVNSFSLRLEGNFTKTKFFMSHYSHQVWPNSHHGSIHLFGHSHGTLLGIGKSMDVGVDTNNFYPYHLDEIMFYMKDIDIANVDHHNELTT